MTKMFMNGKGEKRRYLPMEVGEEKEAFLSKIKEEGWNVEESLRFIPTTKGHMVEVASVDSANEPREKPPDIEDRKKSTKEAIPAPSPPEPLKEEEEKLPPTPKKKKEDEVKPSVLSPSDPS